MKMTGFQPRFYRQWSQDHDLVSCNVTLKETDLLIRAGSNLSKKAFDIVQKQRRLLEGYITRHPEFATARSPLSLAQDAPRIVREMSAAADLCGVGPMAAVAGAFAEFVGQSLLEFSDEIIVENGGDIFLKIQKPRTIGIYAGNSPYSGKLGVQIESTGIPLGICTSSGTVGHSYSAGSADAAVILASSAILADAVATATGNLVKTAADLENAIEFGRRIDGVKGVLVIYRDRLAVWGNMKLVQSEQ